MFATQEADFAGRGNFAKKDIKAGTRVLDRSRPLVWALKDEHERRSCRSCLQPVVDEAIDISSDSSPKSVTSWVTCPKCLRSVVCLACSDATTRHATNGNSASKHDQLECDSLVGLSKLEQNLPSTVNSLLGGNTIYLRLLLRVLGLRAGPSRVRAFGEQLSGGHGDMDEDDGAIHDFKAIEDLEDHLDDILSDAELGARIYNTARAAKMVAPAVWKASQDYCVSLLGKLYCNSMTIGQAGISTTLVRRGYWSKIRGCLYTDFGVGLFPRGAMFNHSCAPNCMWLTDREGTLSITAVRDIESGEELTISYVDILQPGGVRRGLLKDHYFFLCACQRCSRTGATSCRRRGGRRPRVAHAGVQAGAKRARRDESRSRDRGSCASGGDQAYESDMASGGWVCRRRGCAGKGRLLRPPHGPPDEESRNDDEACRISDRNVSKSEEDMMNVEGEEKASTPGVCRLCGTTSDAMYFERWEEILGTRLVAADEKFVGRRARQGRRALKELLVLCEQRLVATHAFTLGVLCRLTVAAMAASDWVEAAGYAERALTCTQRLCPPQRSRDSLIAAPGDLLEATNIWKALLIQALEVALSGADRTHERETKVHKARMAFAEETAATLGLRLRDLIQV